MWAKESLFQYRSPSFPDFTFYYQPLPRYQQQQYRRGYHRFPNTQEFMAELLRMRLVVLSEKSANMVYRYAWPVEEEAQDHLIQRLPKELVIEAGAVILGWMREREEGAEMFMSRVVGDLKEALL